MPFGLDASIAASRAFEDEGHPVAASAPQRIRADEARAPAEPWRFEARDAPVANKRREGVGNPKESKDSDICNAPC